VADIVNGCVGAQDADDEGDYINDLLMSQRYGVAGSGDIRAGRMVRSAQGGFRTRGTAYGVAESSAGCAS
jgi:hypothetical protein